MNTKQLINDIKNCSKQVKLPKDRLDFLLKKDMRGVTNFDLTMIRIAFGMYVGEFEEKYGIDFESIN